jgi:DNA-binding GntR family transcriptional regulator
MVEPQQIQMSTRSAAVADELRRLIRAGELAPGARLRQVDIAQRFGVSTTPVREAFTALAQEGLLIQDAHRGVVVFVPTREDLQENYEIRIPLEALATELAAKSITPQELAELDEMLDEMRKALRSGDLARYGLELNPALHFAIYAAARRPRLFEIIEQLREACAAYMQVLVAHEQRHPPEYVRKAHREHEDIVEALKAGAAKRAAKAMAQHLQHSSDRILASLSELPKAS